MLMPTKPDTPAGTSRPFRPAVRDWQYLHALREVLRDPGHAPRAKMLQMMGLRDRSALVRMEANARRMAWVREQQSGERRETQWEHILDRAYAHAVSAGAQHAHQYMAFFGKATMRLADTSAGASPFGGEQPERPLYSGAAPPGSLTILNWARRSESDPLAARKVGHLRV
jgi:hypothetical protein